MCVYTHSALLNKRQKIFRKHFMDMVLKVFCVNVNLPDSWLFCKRLFVSAFIDTMSGTSWSTNTENPSWDCNVPWALLSLK